MISGRENCEREVVRLSDAIAAYDLTIIGGFLRRGVSVTRTLLPRGTPDDVHRSLPGRIEGLRFYVENGRGT